MGKTAKKKSTKVTPLMKQYFDIKAKHPDAILLFRVGDFYETFSSDAVEVSKILGIVLTSRNNGGSDVELAGFPYHSMNVYLPKLVRAGHRVAVCEQLEKPSKEKKIVKRGVIDIVTPGVTIDDNILDQKANNYLAAIHFTKGKTIGVSFLDISTGEFSVSEGSLSSIEKLIQSFDPSEIIYGRDYKNEYESIFRDKYYSYPIDEWVFTEDYAREKLLDQFEVMNLKGFGIQNMPMAQIAGGAALHYLQLTHNDKVKHITNISRIEQEEYVWLDRFTIKNLELIHSTHPSGLSLIDIIDKTISPMGGRLLRKWTILPLKKAEQIKNRLDVVSHFYKNEEDFETISEQLKKIGDLERLVSKASIGKINPREIVYLKKALEACQPIKEKLILADTKELRLQVEQINLCSELRTIIEQQILSEPATLISKGGVIADGFDEELDELRNLIKNSKDILLNIQQEEAVKTGITNLKIGFNNVFGYYLEVTNKYKNQGLIPENWVRKQTLTGSERYITDELKQLETKILTAQDKVQILEEKLYYELVESIRNYTDTIQKNAKILAELDCLSNFARIARSNQYNVPEIDDSFVIDIKEGRHPVIEQQLKLGESYVPNDVYLDNESQQIMMITGPNMSGKSALLRQTALIAIMAQMGSYVPAESAHIGILDKIFTRVGASDNISSGESTFMVEMNETASIMNNISNRSLILLDEIGRGTSTYDGISIAWSLAEYLHDHPQVRAKTLFATHYHELNELANRHERVKNYNVATKELGQKVIFLRKLVEGGSEHSFGIHVAKMAGMPQEIILRAKEILHHLEQKSIEENSSGMTREKAETVPNNSAMQLNIFETTDPILSTMKDKILAIDINRLTPIECMLKLKELIQDFEQ